MKIPTVVRHVEISTKKSRLLWTDSHCEGRLMVVVEGRCFYRDGGAECAELRKETHDVTIDINIGFED